MSEDKETEERGPIYGYVLGEIIPQEEDGCFKFPGLKKGTTVFLRPEKVCRQTASLPQDKQRGQLAAEGKWVAIVVFDNPADVPLEEKPEYKAPPANTWHFFSWLITPDCKQPAD